MSGNKDEPMRFVSGLVLGAMLAFIGFVLFIAVPKDSAISSLRRQAIERGHAEYVVDINGNATWKWKD